MAEGLSLHLQEESPIPLDLALDVPPGTTLALVGPSGGGKTTILRSIAGLRRPHSGRVSCDGECWFDSAGRIDRPARARRVGFLFQSYALFPHLGARQNVMEAMLEWPPAERRARAEALLAEVGLVGLEDRLPAALSGGQQQRVALARALAREPRVLLLDEPFSAVDYPTRRTLRQLLRMVRARSAAPILLVSHDIEDAARIADRIAFIERGRIVETGPAAELPARPGGALARWMASGG